jgi:CRP-like cAMP-binding protein
MIEVGKSFGWSALASPDRYTNNAECAKDSKVLAIRADGLRDMMRKDPGVVFRVMQHIIATLFSRLKDSREQLFEALEMIEKIKKP